MNENKKDFNKMLLNRKDMPKVNIITSETTIAKNGGNKMFMAPPLFYDKLMKEVKTGELTTQSDMRMWLAKENNCDFTDPMTCGIFVNIAAWASYQRDRDITPYWRTLKANGELNEKYPLGIIDQKEKLEKEGHEVIQKGKKFFVLNYQNKLHVFGGNE